jgi:hypothetical protein
MFDELGEDVELSGSLAAMTSLCITVLGFPGQPPALPNHPTKKWLFTKLPTTPPKIIVF